MAIAKTIRDVQFVVGSDGQPTAALVDIAAWHRLIALLEEAEDQGLLRAYLTRRKTASDPTTLGFIPWEQAEALLDARTGEPDAPVD